MTTIEEIFKTSDINPTDPLKNKKISTINILKAGFKGLYCGKEEIIEFELTEADIVAKKDGKWVKENFKKSILWK